MIQLTYICDMFILMSAIWQIQYNKLRSHLRISSQLPGHSYEVGEMYHLLLYQSSFCLYCVQLEHYFDEFRGLKSMLLCARFAIIVYDYAAAI